jgi:ABC-type antimicrobial peptide transport system permease subunit
VARYQVQNLVSVLHTVGSVSVALSLVLMAVALLTLITAGTGIMNIMFVNIAQRTREIGLRKAIGARPAEIRMQFLLEAAFISFAGAAIGVVIAMGLVWLVTGWVTADVPISISWSGVSIALLLSTAIGTSFGYQPASRAASLNPVEALRAE